MPRIFLSQTALNDLLRLKEFFAQASDLIWHVMNLTMCAIWC